MQWANFLAKEAATNGLSLEQTVAFAKYFQTENLGKTKVKLASELNVDITAFTKWVGEVYDKFAQNSPELATFNNRDKLEKLQAYLSVKYNSELDALKPLAAMKLLKSLVVRERLQQEAWVARRICKFLGYLPLALELVGRYLDKMPDLSLETLLKRLEKKRVEHEPVVNANSLMPDEYGIFEAFELSWEQLDENAQSFGCLLSLCALADIPLSVETIEDDKKQKLNEKAIADLLELHLLHQKSKGIYLLNPQIRQLFQVKLHKSSEADEAKTKFAAMMLEVAKLIPQQLNSKDILNFTPHIPHITEVATHLSEYLGDENLITLFTKLAWFYQSQGLYQQAEPWLQRCVELTQNRLGLEHSDVATSLNNLAALYETTGRYREAEPLLEKALALRKRLLGEEHNDVATSLSYLALIYEYTGRYSEAEPLYQQALELWKRLVGEQHPHVATSLNNLGALYCYTKRYSEAEPLLKQALKLRKRLLGDNHPDVATSLNNLAQLYESTGSYKQAEPLYEQALELSKRLLGNNHPDVAISLNNLAALYRHTRRYRKAKPLFEKALKICERTLGISHPTTMTVRANYASFLREAYH
ncbi:MULTISPECIES: tetratricopeptide repeat protein [unclassified Nostoc]|uniref:tetratricopeptide repeat protein n=1 Tax=unclassified Nostoc TaxID=2593658 RepID=UPI0025AB3ACD|nr:MULTISPECIES: tetratricopeptide repeat protein [unclassified Nostoc]MDM9583891.1 tetratricopeptide repeat protein [Nostoc sp. GT001]MDZ7947456.1 tetratricopeptide repeat protein [Nostoc sp. EfeVER01]MDZ7993238.1 tetratricopeptide repeat protein [Nostoc sp. EspVER01]